MKLDPDRVKLAGDICWLRCSEPGYRHMSVTNSDHDLVLCLEHWHLVLAPLERLVDLISIELNTEICSQGYLPWQDLFPEPKPSSPW